MNPNPVAVGLSLCDYVIVEERTKKVSLIGEFTSIRVAGFPIIPLPFSVHCTLTDGQGDGIIELLITRLETEDVVYSLQRGIRLLDQLKELRVHFRIRNCLFPASGVYEVSLVVDGAPIGRRRLQVYEGDSP